MEIYLWSYFLKEPNSTKRPNDADKIVKNCQFTDEMSVINPTFILQDWENYTYAYFPNFNRYYFIDNVVYTKSHTLVTMTCDVLATYKNAIGSSRQYIARSASAYNANLLDMLYPQYGGNQMIERKNTSTAPFLTVPDYIIQIMGKNGVRSYQMNAVSLSAIMSLLWDSWRTLDGMTELYQAIFDPSQYIVGAKRCYISSTHWTGATAVSSIAFGDLVISGGFSAIDITDAHAFVGLSLTLPIHPQSVPYSETAPRLDYLRFSPFTSYSIRVPGVGWVDLNANDIYSISPNSNYTVNLNYEIEATNGGFICDITTGDNAVTIASVTGTVMCAWAIGTNNIDTAGGLMQGISTIASIATGDILGTANGVASTAAALQPTMQMTGSNAAIQSFAYPFAAVLRYNEIVQTDPVHHGRPLMQSRQIDTLRGYVECIGAEFGSALTQEENRKIINYMNGGFYFE